MKPTKSTDKYYAANRKPSWQYDDLAFKIQVPPRQQTSKLILLFLGKVSDDKGQSFYGYGSIAAHCCIARTKIPHALQKLHSLGIVTWKSGTGGPQKQDTNI